MEVDMEVSMGIDTVLAVQHAVKATGSPTNHRAQTFEGAMTNRKTDVAGYPRSAG